MPVYLCSVSINITNPFPKIVVLSSAVYENCSCSIPLSTLAIFCLFHFTYSVGYVVISHCSFKTCLYLLTKEYNMSDELRGQSLRVQGASSGTLSSRGKFKIFGNQ